MKKIILIIIVTLFLMPTLSRAQAPGLTFEWDPCIEYRTGVGWHIDLNYNASSCTPYITLQFWVYHSSGTYGPYTPSQQTGSSATFILPSILNSILENGECIEIETKYICDQAGGGVNTYESQTLCPCEEGEPVKDYCIAQFEFSGNTQSLNNLDYPMQFDENEYPVEGAYVQDQLQYYNYTNCPDLQLCYDSYGNPYNAGLFIMDYWLFGDGSSLDLNSRANSASYDISKLSHDKITHIYASSGSYQVCHRKIVGFGCIESPFTAEYDSDDPCAGGRLYDCSVCYDICVNDPYTIGEPVYTIPEVVSAFSSQKRDNSSGSKIIEVNDIMIAPNPAQNIINVSFKSNEEQTYIIKIYDLTGKVLISQSVNLHKGYNTNQMEVSNITNGNYILAIEDNLGNGYKEKITILR